MNRTIDTHARRRLLVATAIAAAFSAQAADRPVPPPPEPGWAAGLQAEAAEAVRQVAQLGDDTLGWIGQEFRHERIVKGAPYCADAVHETVQPLADGNRIVQRQTTRLCRDGEGRTRQEVTTRDGRATVYLRDPVARENWVLDPERKLARRGTRIAIGGPGSEMHLDSGAWRDYAERMREWARQWAERARESMRGSAGAASAAGRPQAAPPAPPPPPAPPAPVVISRSEATAAAGDGARREVEVQVLRIPGDGPGLPPLPGMAAFDVAVPPPAVGQHARLLAPRGPGAVTALPAREIEGVRVNGERTTWTIEAGKVGNEKPIVITREVWTSPELMLTVQSRDVDPRTGEVSYRLQNLRRGEPDPALFKVPADYTQRPPRTPGAPSAPARG